jgi:hypothetical protein
MESYWAVAENRSNGLGCPLIFVDSVGTRQANDAEAMINRLADFDAQSIFPFDILPFVK